MLRKLVGLLAVLSLGLALSSIRSAPAEEKLKVLIIDGQHNHKWKETTPALKEMLTKTGRFEVDVVTTPPDKAPKDAWAQFHPDFSKYKSVLPNYTGTPWPAETQKAMEKYMEDGGGLVFVHAATFSFPGWAAWNKMMGMGWRDNKYGESVALDKDGKVVRIPKGEGPNSGHGAAWAFEVQVRDTEHPVMKGLPAKFTQVVDELYQGLRGPAQDMQILATAFAPKGEHKGTDMHQPVVWTVPAGKGRVFVTLLGHDVKAITSTCSVDLICRGTEWAATGQVTIPAQTK